MSTNKRITQSDKMWDHVGEEFISEQGLTEATALMGTVEGLRQAVIALVEQQALANRIALGDFDRDELLKFLNA